MHKTSDMGKQNISANAAKKLAMDSCRQCGSTPREWEHLNDGLCPECYWKKIKDV